MPFLLPKSYKLTDSVNFSLTLYLAFSSFVCINDVYCLLHFIKITHSCKENKNADTFKEHQNPVALHPDLRIINILSNTSCSPSFNVKLKNHLHHKIIFDHFSRVLSLSCPLLSVSLTCHIQFGWRYSCKYIVPFPRFKIL